MNLQFIKHKLKRLDTNYKHPSYYLEKKLIHEIKSCLLEDATETLNAINSIERAELADSPIRSLKNSLIASCTLFARAAVEANVNSEDVFSMSDMMIMKLESINHINDLKLYEYDMVKQFIRLIKNARISHYSYQVTTMIQYIHAHITEKITLDDMVFITKNSKEYLSRLFKEELGITIIDYIMEQKIEVSKKFLDHSYMSIAEIAILFNFCSATYYSKTFKKITGTTPSEYKKKQH